MERIYLDHAAGAPLDLEVSNEMRIYEGGEYGNPSSLYESGRRARWEIEKARTLVAQIIESEPDEVIFTSGGTESDNLAILGVAHAYAHCGRHILLSAIEHKAVIEAGRSLVLQGFDVEYIPVDEYGQIDVRATLALVRKDTILISVMLANNEIGTIEPIADLARELRTVRGGSVFPLLHTDACQAAGYLPISVGALGVDLMTLSGSKIYGPKGVGILYRKKHVQLKPLLCWGAQQGGVRPGTEPTPLIVGFATALRKAEELRVSEVARLEALRQWFIEELKMRIPGLRINGHLVEHLPHIVHVTVPAIEGESMVLMCDASKIEVATGSACSSYDLSPSHVLRAIDVSSDDVHGSLRFSMGRSTTKKQLEYVLHVFPHIVQQLRNATALTTQHYERTRKTIV
jgi:cysteine desulfurase